MSSVPDTFFDESQRRRHRVRNIAQTVLLVVGIGALFAATAYLIAGWPGVQWGIVGLGLAMLFTPRLSPRLVLRLFDAEEIPEHAFPQGYRIVQWLARRAGLDTPPRLFFVPTPEPTAFTVTSGEEPTIAITDGLLHIVDEREFAAVMAHEISHVRHRDLWLMALADAISRFTRLMGLMGFFLIAASVPLWLMGEPGVPPVAALLLVLAPTAGTLLQLALSRTREFDADLGAVELTGDPEGLASALAKLERSHRGPWGLFLPRHHHPDPSPLRSHPKTEDRIARLRELVPRAPSVPFEHRHLHVPTRYHAGSVARRRVPCGWF